MELPEEKIRSGALPPDNMDLKLRIQNMRETDLVNALSKERDFGDTGAKAEMDEIASRDDEYYIAKIKEREAKSKE